MLMAIIGIIFIAWIFWVAFFKENHDLKTKQKETARIIEKNNQQLEKAKREKAIRIIELEKRILFQDRALRGNSNLTYIINDIHPEFDKIINEYILLTNFKQTGLCKNIELKRILVDYQSREVAEIKKRLEREQSRKLEEERKRKEEQLKQEKILQQKIQSYKADWENFRTILQQRGITKLYHFTDRANLESIKQKGGLFSWYYCKQNNISISKPGGSQTSWSLDFRKGLQNYVRVSFIRDHPMMYIARNDGRISNPVILEIATDLIYLKSTKYTSQNAAKNDAFADNTLEAFNKIKFNLFSKRYLDLLDDEKHYYQAEVLVLEKIPLESIININYV